eukprot:gene7806-10601_t
MSFPAYFQIKLSKFSKQKVNSYKMYPVQRLCNSYLYSFSLFSSSIAVDDTEEILITNPNNSILAGTINHLAKKRKKLQVIYSERIHIDTGAIWSLHRNKLQIDGTRLEPQYLSGKTLQNSEDSANIWNNLIEKRITLPISTQKNISNNPKHPKYEKELEVAKFIVNKTSFVSRSLQSYLLSRPVMHDVQSETSTSSSSSSISKDDKTPVTIADFATQAIIIDFISTYFPNDNFIAEEDSALVRADEQVCDAILDAIHIATGGSKWSREKLFTTIDRGSSGNFSHLSHDSGDNKSSRVWVLDPIDGTKGFLRGQHYCIALALLVNGLPKLSVLGCPNLNLLRVLQDRTYDSYPIGYVDPIISLTSPIENTTSTPPLQVLGADQELIHHNNGYNESVYEIRNISSGSLFYAVSSYGAFARTIAMPLDAAFEVSVSGVSDSPSSTLCESIEAFTGDRRITESVAKSLRLSKDYVRLDGQCKYCVVGSGSAEGNLRLPPDLYQERIWDHAPGTHFILEAGGTVTDLEGRELDFSQGKLLSKDVKGIVASNGLMHTRILKAIQEAKTIHNC